MNGTPRFLSIEDVLTLHAIAIEDQGGDPVLRDHGLLESALAQPKQQFAGAYLHEDIPAMAAAYAFHICMNHPFADGNKRAATAAMIVFLADNGWSFDATADEAEPVILQLAAGEMEKAALTEWVRAHCHEKPHLELRDFLRSLTWEQIRDMVRSVVEGASESEATSTSAEATLAIPLVGGLQEAVLTAQKEKSAEYPYLNAIMIFLIAVYRVAEDSGYEW
ncbi:MAG: type II toxin-antitoxin system death-on-curing family toxin [Phycisphaeraceae bacterium]